MRPPNAPLPTRVSAETVVWVFIIAIVFWLFWSAYILGIETGDGYVNIISAQHLLGLNEGYGSQRGPFLPFYLTSAEWISNFLQLYPLDVRVHHAFSALLHAVYVVLTWILLRNFFRPADFSVVIAFLATIPSFIFFSYGVFISPDIFPGMLLLSMLLLVDKLAQTPSWSTWTAFVLIGALAVFIKQTYAVFWISILIACWAMYPRKLVFILILGASVSAAISWTGYALYTHAASSHSSSFWAAPFEQITWIKDQYDTTTNRNLSEIFPWWLYLINLTNYGTLLVIIIVPSIIYSTFFLKEKPDLFRTSAIVLVIIFLVLQILPFKEVRYLACLTPLGAFLLVPFLRYLLNSKCRLIYLFPALIILSIDLSKALVEALRVNLPIYQHSTFEYFSPLDTTTSSSRDNTKFDRKVFLVNHTGFYSDLFSPLKADRYHRTFHIQNNVLRYLYGNKLPNTAVFTHNDKVNFELLSVGDIFLFSNQIPLREPPWTDDNRPNLASTYGQFLGTADRFILTNQGSHFHLLQSSGDTRPIALINDENHKFKILLGYDTFKAQDLAKLFGENSIRNVNLELIGIRINRLCDINGCYDMDNQGNPIYSLGG